MPFFMSQLLWGITAFRFRQGSRKLLYRVGINKQQNKQIMTKEMKQEYATPQVEMIDARVERGFEGSVSSGNPEGLEEGDEHGDEIFS